MKKRYFDLWNEKKKLVHFCESRPYFSVGEIWWASLGQNVSTEIFGKGEDFLRPVLILKLVYGNACLAIPLTSKRRDGDYYYSFVDSKNNFQCGLLTQIRYLDGKRLKYKQSTIRRDDFSNLKTAFQHLINK